MSNKGGYFYMNLRLNRKKQVFNPACRRFICQIWLPATIENNGQKAKHSQNKKKNNKPFSGKEGIGYHNI